MSRPVQSPPERSVTGTYLEDVAVDPFGVTCSDCLDFAFQVSLDPGLSAGIFNVIVGRYFGSSTDAGYINGSGQAPVLVQRGPIGGGPLAFHFGLSSQLRSRNCKFRWCG